MTLGIWDIVAGATLLLGWLAYPWIIRLFPGKELTEKVAASRKIWMLEMLGRSDRITDVSLARGLMQSVAFLASTSVLLITGALGLIGSAGFVVDLINQSAWLVPTTQDAFEIKTVFLLLIFVQSFFRLTWAMRLHSYSLILIGAAPQPEEKDAARSRRIAEKSADFSALASRHYLAGLRGYYFGLATLAWYVSPILLIGAVLFTFLILVRREHYSKASSLFDDIANDLQQLPPEPKI